jgi:excisionase family DNA binding protein
MDEGPDLNLRRPRRSHGNPAATSDGQFRTMTEIDHNRTGTAHVLPTLIDIETLAVQLGDSVRQLRRLVAEKRIPCLKVRHFLRFDPEQVKAWLEDHAQEATA